MKEEIPRPKIGVNVFIIKNGQLLLGKRIGKVGFGTWGLPGGHFELGESLMGAAKRELEEETGLVSKELEFLHIINDPHENHHYVHIDFFAKDWSGEPKVTEPDKFAEWKWFDFDKLPEEIFLGHKKSIPAFFEKTIFIDDDEPLTLI